MSTYTEMEAQIEPELRAWAKSMDEMDAQEDKMEAEYEDKIKAAPDGSSEKKRLEQKLANLERAIANRTDPATDKKAAETKLKDKEAEVKKLDEAGQSQRLTKFLEVTTKNHIDPFTEYAKKGHGEFYAEAYSLWLVDREFLEHNYPDVFNFFESGDYRK